MSPDVANGHLLEIGQSIFDEKLKLCDLTEGNVGLLGDIAEGNPRRQLSKGEIAKYIDMSSLSTTGSYPSGWIEKAYNGGMRFANGDTLLARITPCLENGKASYVNFLNESEVAFGSTEYIILTGKDGISNEIFYFLVRNSNFIEYMVGHMNGSSGRQRVSVKDALNYPIHIPEGKTLKAIGQRLSMLLNSVSANSKQIKKLSQLRDALLPKLMSGEIDVSKVELPTPLEQNSATNGRLSARRFVFSVARIMHAVFVHALSERSHMIGNNTIESILKAMQNTLDARQLKQLKSVLSVNLNTETIPDNDNEANELLNSFLTAKELEGCSERTLKYYDSTLTHYLKETFVPLPQVDTEQLRTYLAEYQTTHTVGKVTVDNIRRILSTFFSWLEDEDYIVKSPARKIRRVKAPIRVKETISDEDMERLRDGCETPRDLAMIDLLSSTGMRVGELVKLDRNSINLIERECIVQGKGNKERKAYFDARAKLHLEEYLQGRNDDNPALFVSLSGDHERIAICSVESRLRSLGRKLQLPRIHPHKFRRTMATNAINRGMPVEQVQKLLGHVKIDTTMQYALVSQSNVKASHRKYLG
ncbi:tyrosine-type recombinase/integrase [Bifidobacterium imperatoris]|uniref:Tyrosine-type recombinase/integrase n=1 Tax=Bifidobacterium imperatoris TaxID=2020965 RepID=A0ABX7S1T7_9BIFI|nr:tyrosine-type recombinase/integrase [Bifidobacterium imperatoris]QSY57339.1 tyrosine-type recombinase/integrase [Bifidobacterium imperatoris]